MTPEELRKHAEEILLDHVDDVEFLSISEHLEDLKLDPAEHDAACRAIDALISEATVTVEWPDDPAARADTPPCDRIDLPHDPEAMCADCGRSAGSHPAWSPRLRQAGWR